ncbi:MAG TPA: RAMP superfamily CRISPR-associated protein [Thermodesulfovibrionia bacterium]|nr:RAMP superfamily CRISPR-associated protein [Thermodesulfovibrionia bacterium]
MHHNIKIDIDINLKAKWHTGSGEGNLLVNRLVKRDTRNWPYIPGSTLKGIIRESCEKLSRTLGFSEPSDPHQTYLTVQDYFKPLKELDSPVDKIFGTRYEGCNLFFRNARLSSKPQYGFTKSQSRICKYRNLGTARENHLFTTEYIYPMSFKTTISGSHRNLVFLYEEDPPFAYCLLIAAIMNIDRIGGDKSTGSGLVEMIIDSFEYNGSAVELNKIFDYLDSKLYKESKQIL